MRGVRESGAAAPPRVRVETYIGGALALITLIAAIVRYVYSAQTIGDLMTAAISVTAPLLTLVVLVAAIRSLRALLRKPDESFETILARELDDWLARMRPLVRANDEFDGDADDDGGLYEMLVEHDAVLRRGERLSDKRHVWFLRLPNDFRDGDQLRFYLRESMFTRRAIALDEDRGVMTEKLAKDFATTLGQGFQDIVAVHARPERRVHDTITVTLRRDLTTAEDAHRLMSLINYATLLYLAVA